MTSARCPICDDVITLGVPIKLHQTLICPTCLGRLKAVSINPFEFEPLDRQQSPALRIVNRDASRKKSSAKSLAVTDDFDDDYDYLDDYALKQQLRHKSDREKRRRNTDQLRKSSRY